MVNTTQDDLATVAKDVIFMILGLAILVVYLILGIAAYGYIVGGA